MTLLHLSFDKILGSFFTALIAEGLTNNGDKNIVMLGNNYYPLTIVFDILKSLTDDVIIDEQLLVSQFKNLSATEISIALFPSIIYNYQSPEKLAQQLAIISENGCYSKVSEDGVIVFIIIVNLILSKQLELKQITPQIMPYLEDKKQETINHLQLIDKMIIDKHLLTEVDCIFRQKFRKDFQGIYQGLYSFFSYPSNFENSLLRSTYFSQESQSTAILTGYLLGLYHGYLNIPHQWRLHSSPPSSQIQLNPKIKEIVILTKKLVANWQGKMDNQERK